MDLGLLENSVTRIFESISEGYLIEENNGSIFNKMLYYALLNMIVHETYIYIFSIIDYHD